MIYILLLNFPEQKLFSIDFYSWIYIIFFFIKILQLVDKTHFRDLIFLAVNLKKFRGRGVDLSEIFGERSSLLPVYVDVDVDF